MQVVFFGQTIVHYIYSSLVIRSGAVFQWSNINSIRYYSYIHSPFASLFLASYKYYFSQLVSRLGVATTVPTPLNKRITNTIYGDQGELTYAGFDGDPSSGSLQVRHHIMQ